MGTGKRGAVGVREGVHRVLVDWAVAQNGSVGRAGGEEQLFRDCEASADPCG